MLAIHLGPVRGRERGSSRGIGVRSSSRGNEPLAIHRGPIRGREGWEES